MILRLYGQDIYIGDIAIATVAHTEDADNLCTRVNGYIDSLEQELATERQRADDAEAKLTQAYQQGGQDSVIEIGDLATRLEALQAENERLLAFIESAYFENTEQHREAQRLLGNTTD